MNWDAIGAIGEIVGALAVVVSLIYLATQIRISNNASKQSATRELHDHMTHFLGRVVDNTDNARVWTKGNLDDDDLTLYEKVQYRTMQTQLNNLMERMYYTSKDNADAEKYIWTGTIKQFRQVIASPGYQSWFKDRKFTLNDEWRSFLEAEISNITDEYRPAGVKVEKIEASENGT